MIKLLLTKTSVNSFILLTLLTISNCAFLSFRTVNMGEVYDPIAQFDKDSSQLTLSFIFMNSYIDIVDYKLTKESSGITNKYYIQIFGRHLGKGSSLEEIKKYSSGQIKYMDNRVYLYLQLNELENFDEVYISDGNKEVKLNVSTTD